MSAIATNAAPLQIPLSPRAKPTPGCRHCGAPLRGAPSADSGFCCAGCAYVWRLVHEHGLDGYYRIKDPVTPPADPSVFHPRDFSWLEAAQQEAELAAASALELTLEIQGLSCAGCVWLIERVFRQERGAREIEVIAQVGQMRLQWIAGEFNAARFARTLQSFGYLVGPLGDRPAEPETNGLVRRIGLCTAFAMNVMLFTLPTYFGMERSFAYAPLFGTLSLAFGTLSLLVGGSYFLGRAFQAARAGVIHLDVPIALGIAGAYAGSLYGWLSGREAFVYFDFVSGFILLMLVGRWAQVAAVDRNRRRLLSAHARPQRVRVSTEAGLVERAAESLEAGERFAVGSGHFVPVESRLESSAATLGLASITGEASPLVLVAGSRVLAGAINLGRQEILLHASQSWKDSLLAQLLRPVSRDLVRHRFLERVIRGYLCGILAAAALAGFGWWFGTHDVVRAWSVVTAILVVSCPCALGLAFPLTDEIATVAVRRYGVFVREGDLWPRLRRLRTVIFDKTGTLTLELPLLTNPEALTELTAEARSALLALVTENPHPFSQSILAGLQSGGRTTALGACDSPQEEIGHGMWLRTEGRIWALGRPGWRGARAINSSDEGDSELTCDGVVVARFRFKDHLRPDAAREVCALQARGLSVFILSGDRREKVQAMAAALNLNAEDGIAETTPQEKAAWVRSIDHRDTLMLGDGANDSLAFEAAFVRGTPVVHRGVLESKADFYYLGRGLAGLRRLLEVDTARRRTHRALLAFSLCYNLAAIGLAAAGHMNPLLAAILMPVSSLVTLTIVAVGMRRLAG